jgi:hypothetical protein
LRLLQWNNKEKQQHKQRHARPGTRQVRLTDMTV